MSDNEFGLLECTVTSPNRIVQVRVTNVSIHSDSSIQLPHSEEILHHECASYELGIFIVIGLVSNTDLLLYVNKHTV